MRILSGCSARTIGAGFLASEWAVAPVYAELFVPAAAVPVHIVASSDSISKILPSSYVYRFGGFVAFELQSV